MIKDALPFDPRVVFFADMAEWICNFNTCYRAFVEVRQHVDEARDTCQRHGAHLVSINDEEEYLGILGYIKDLANNTIPSPQYEHGELETAYEIFWTSGRREGDHWVWMDGSNDGRGNIRMIIIRNQYLYGTYSSLQNIISD